MAEIEVEPGSGDPSAPTFIVTVADDGTSTRHEVTVGGGMREVADRYPSVEGFVEACFRFLLEREPKESILASFDVSEIARYFPEFERTIVPD